MKQYKKIFKEANLQGGSQAEPIESFMVKFLKAKQSKLEDLKGVELSENDIEKISKYFYFMFLNIIEIMPDIKSSKREGFLYKKLMSHQLSFENEMKKFKSEQLAKKGIERKQLNDNQIVKRFIKSKNLQDEWFELFSRGSLDQDEPGYVKMANEFFKQNNIPVKVINGLEQDENSGIITWLVELKK